MIILATYLQRFLSCNLELLLYLLTPNEDYSGRTAPLTSKRCILYIYSTQKVLNILNTLYTLRFCLFKMQFVS